MDTFDLIAEATSSSTRFDLLMGLLRESATRRELADEHGVTRSTMHRHLEPLQRCGWVEQTPEREYRLSAVGEQIARALKRLRLTIEQAEANEAFLERYRGDVEIPAEVLAEASVATATLDNGQQAAREHLDVVDSSLATDASVRLVGGTTGPVISEMIERLCEVTAELEIIVDERTARAEGCALYDRVQRGAADSYSLLLHPEPLEFGLVLFDDRLAMVGAYDATGNITASFQGSSEAVIRWAEDTYRRIRAQATVVE